MVRGVAVCGVPVVERDGDDFDAGLGRFGGCGGSRTTADDEDGDSLEGQAADLGTGDDAVAGEEVGTAILEREVDDATRGRDDHGEGREGGGDRGERGKGLRRREKSGATI